MKNIKFILVALVAIFVTLGSTSVYAQEDGNRDANGYVVKGPYLTNGGGSNWFVGVGGGFNTSVAVGVQPFNSFKVADKWTAEAFVGKWFTPSIGVRAGYKGGVNSFVLPEGFTSAYVASGEQVRFGYAHADLMWNISNALSGYKETRFWDIIPYAGAGYLGVNNGHTMNKLGVSAGIYNELRINRTINLYVDLSVIGTDRKAGFLGIQNAEGAPVVTNETFLLKRAVYMPSATVGITFNLGKKKNFDRYSSVAPVALPFTLNDYNNLNKRVGALEQENSDLKDKLIAAQNKEPEKVVVKETVQVLVGSTVITFPMGKSTLSTVEREKVEMFAKAFDGQDVVVKVVGSADSKTGTAKRNNQLAKERADVVKDVLVKNGVPADRITVESTLDATENVETSRSAIVTLE